VVPIIANTNLDLFDLGLEGIFMHQQDDKPTIEKDDVLHPPPPPPIFPLHLLSLITRFVLPIH